MSDFVESMVPLKAIKSAVELQHWHDNLSVLDLIVSDGSAAQYLGADGQYHDVPPLFDVDAFLDNFNQTGNVQATKSTEGQLTLNYNNLFAQALGNKVVGDISFVDGGDSSIDVVVTKVSPPTGVTSVAPFSGFVGTGAVLLSLVTSGESQVLQIGLDPNKEPLSSLMSKAVPTERLNVAVLDTDGQVIDSEVNIDDLTSDEEFQAHVDNTTVHVTVNEKADWSGKQEALSTTQLAAVNSGITSAKISQYDGYATSKVSSTGNPSGKNVVTDENGNFAFEDKLNLSDTMKSVPTATAGNVANFTATGQVSDSGVQLGQFTQGQTVRQYIDSSIASTISGSSYQGTVTYFGTQSMVEAVTDAVADDTALIFSGTLSSVAGMSNGVYNGTSWTWSSMPVAPTNGAWWECDHVLTNTPPIDGRIIMRQDGINDPSLDVRLSTSTPIDDITIDLNEQGAITFKTKRLSSGKVVLNSTTSDSIAYNFVSDGGVDVSKTLKEVIEANAAAAEPKFTKNTAFNKNFDTSSQSATSTKVIGDKDTRLSDARPASDVSAWAKASSLAVSSVPNLPATKITSGTFSIDRIADGSITSAKLKDSYATAAQGTLATNAVRSVTAGTTSTAGNTAISVNTGGTSTTIQLSVAGLKALAFLDKIDTSLITGLGSAAYKAVSTSVTSGSGDLVTSGAVSTAISALPASAITSGTLSLARGGTGVAIGTGAGAVYHSANATSLSVGTLPVSVGGTGATSYTAGAILLGNGTSAFGTRSIVTTLDSSTNIPTSGAVMTAINSLAVANVGSTNSSTKLFLVGATSQASSTTGYSNSAVYTQSGYLYASRVYNAVFNDYAEYRLCRQHIKPGYIVTEDSRDCDYVVISNGKGHAKKFAVSDTFGTCMGCEENSVPVALAGRVLLYIKNKKHLKVGDYIGCAKDGQGRKMSRLEAWLHPNRVIGTVSSIPTYKVWGTNEVVVDGRVWVNLK